MQHNLPIDVLIQHLAEIIGKEFSKSFYQNLLSNNSFDVNSAANDYFQKTNNPKPFKPFAPPRATLLCDDNEPVSPALMEQEQVEEVQEGSVGGAEVLSEDDEEIDDDSSAIQEEITENFKIFCKKQGVSKTVIKILLSNGLSDLAFVAKLTHLDIAQLTDQGSAINMGTQMAIRGLVSALNQDSIPLGKMVTSVSAAENKKPLFAYDVNFLYMLQDSFNEPHDFKQLFQATKDKIENWIPYYVVMEIDNQDKRKGDGRVGELSRMANSLLKKLVNMQGCIGVERLQPDSAINSTKYITNDDIIVRSIGKHGKGRAIYVCSVDKAMGVRAMSVGTIVRTVDQFYHILTEFGITNLPTPKQTPKPSPKPSTKPNSQHIPKQTPKQAPKQAPEPNSQLFPKPTPFPASLKKKFILLVKGCSEDKKEELKTRIANILNHENFSISFIKPVIAKIFLESDADYLKLLALRRTQTPLSFERYDFDFYIRNFDGVNQDQLSNALKQIADNSVHIYKHLNVALVRFSFSTQKLHVPSCISLGKRELILSREFDRMVCIKMKPNFNFKQFLERAKTIKTTRALHYRMEGEIIEIWCDDLKFLNQLAKQEQQQQQQSQQQQQQQQQNEKVAVSPSILFANFFCVGVPRTINHDEAVNMYKKFMGDCLHAKPIANNGLMVTMPSAVRDGYFAFLDKHLIMVVSPNMRPKAFLFCQQVPTPETKKAMKQHELVQQHGTSVNMFPASKLFVIELKWSGVEAFKKLPHLTVCNMIFTVIVVA